MSIVTKNALRVLATVLSFLTIAAIPSVVLAQQGALAACAPDIQAQCAGHTVRAAGRASRRVSRTFLCPANLRW